MERYKPIKRKISYQWRLFLPLVAILWVILLTIAGWQTFRAYRYQSAFVEQHLKLINERVSRAWKNGDNETILIFKDFMEEYYDKEPLFDEIRLSIFDGNWNAVDSLRVVIHLTPEEMDMVPTEMFERVSMSRPSDIETGRRAYFLISPLVRNGDQFYVVSSLPNDDEYERYITGSMDDVWFFIFTIAVVVTVLAFIITRRLGRNINLLNQFAERVANDSEFVPGTEFAHDELGDIARKIVKIYEDRVRARDEIEHEHRMSIHTLEEKARQKRQLTNNINHELKTPIGVIKGYLDTILDTPGMDENTKNHFLNKAREHADRLVNLVADVSSITRLDEGDGQIGTEQLDFHELVYVFANDAYDSGMLGHFHMDVNIPLGIYIRGNNNLLVGVMMNLTRNAVNYSGGDRIVVEYRGEVDNFYKFAFYDNGNGVPPTSIEHLFDRFYRIDSGRARKTGGTGLGLAIVYNTFKAHGGSIVARNIPGGGLEFEFTLPRWHA